MDEATSDELEEAIFSGFRGLCLRDKETGETICVNKDVETGETAPLNCGPMKPLHLPRSGFRIPLALSKLGMPSSVSPPAEIRNDKQDDLSGIPIKLSVNLPEYLCAEQGTSKGLGSLTEPPKQVEKLHPMVCTDSSEAPIQKVDNIVATAGCPTGKFAGLFCRKRKLATVPTHTKAVAKQTKPVETCKMPRFLEGRGGLLRAIQLFLVLLSLVSPGFFFPCIFIIKVMCHSRQHYETIEQNLDGKKEHPSCYFIQQACPLCREQRKADNMFRLHNKINGTEKQSNKTSCRFDQNCKLCA